MLCNIYKAPIIDLLVQISMTLNTSNDTYIIHFIPLYPLPLGHLIR